MATADHVAGHGPDVAPGTVEVPHDLADALAGRPAAAEAFSASPPSHQREYVTWIVGAKRADTRARRIAKALEMLEDRRDA